jgi:hypothetical protein
LQVAGGRDWEELGKAFDQAQDDGGEVGRHAGF